MTVDGITIRRCRPDECAAVLALWTRAGAIPSPTDTPGELARLVRSEHGDGFLVALSGGGLVGSIIGGFDGWRGNIYRLAVAPELRRRGLAQALVREAERVLWAKGARRMTALVDRHAPDAIAFWDRAPGYRWDERIVRYVKALGPETA